MSISSCIDTSREGKLADWQRDSVIWHPEINENVRRRMVEQIQRREDSVYISEAAMRLCIGGKRAGAGSWERVAADTSNEMLREIDKGVELAGKLLEQMKAIADSALDKSLDAEARLKLQLEMERLGYELEQTANDVADIFSRRTSPHADSSAPPFFDTKKYKMLMRAYDRLLGEGEWDVAEVECQVVEFVPKGEYGGEWLKTGALVWETTDNPLVPTVGEIIKTNCRSLMDRKAAAITGNEIKRDIKKLTAFRSELISYVQEGTENQEDSNAEERLDALGESFMKTIAGFCKSVSLWDGKLLVDLMGKPKYRDKDGNIVSFKPYDPGPPAVIMTSLPESEAFSESGNEPVSETPEITPVKPQEVPDGIDPSQLWPLA